MRRIFYLIILVTYTTYSALSSTFQDRAALFSPQTQLWAQEEITKLQKKHGFSVALFSEVYLPTGKKVQERAMELAPRPFQGLLIYISERPKKLYLAPTKKMHQAFGRENLKKMRTLMIGELKNQNPDQALKTGLNFLDTHIRVQKAKAQAEPQPVPAKVAAGFPWKNLLLLMAFVGIIFWFINRKKKNRDYTSQLRQQQRQQHSPHSKGSYDDGGGPFAGQRGAGAGSMLGSMATGLAGAFAGHWLYDKFFGDSASTPADPTQPAASAFEAQAADEPFKSNTDSWNFDEAAFDQGAGDDWGSADAGSDMDFGGGDFGGDEW